MRASSSGHRVAVPSMDSKPSTCGRRSAGWSRCLWLASCATMDAQSNAYSQLPMYLGNQNANDDGQLVERPQSTPKMSGGDFAHIHRHQP